MDLTVRIKGVEPILKELTQMRKRSLDWSVLTQTFHDILIERMKERFDSHNRSEGFAAWANYEGEPKYRAYKRAMVNHLDPLRWEKDGTYEMLYPSLIRESDPHHIYQQTGPKNWIYGTSVPHSDDVLSETIGPFNEPSPARDFITLGNETLNALTETAMRWIFRGEY